MLQRAAGNAYSWWWASHIRTKQSKWLDGDLQEMEERVKNMLKLLGEEADSFGKRAEMYYKKRPEVILSVEEAYRAYRALAERYDHISGELHKANHTIATAFPDQVHYAMLEEEEDNIPKAITPVDSSKIHKQTVDGLMKKKRDGKLPVLKEKKGISKENAQEEINKLQKEILMIQTEKEFIKSSYESGIAKFWELEKKMADVQEEIIFLQEEFNASAVFEDDEARALMTATALKSCEETIFNLREKQKKSLEMERIELERIKVSRERLRVIKSEYGRVKSENSSSDLDLRDLELKSEGEKDYEIKMERMEMETICEKIKSRFEMESEVSIEVTVEKIDQLVNKVVDLELFVSSQTAQINRLNLENGQLEKHLENMETEKADLVNDSSELNEKLKQAEEELSIVQSIQKAVMKEESNVRLNFSQVVNNLSEVSDALQSPIVNEEISIVNSFGETSVNGDNSNESDYFETNGDLLCASNGEHSIDNSKGSVCFETNGDLISSSNGENLIDNVCFETNKDLISASNGEHLLDNNTKSVRFETKEEQVLDSRTGSVHFETSGDNVIDNSTGTVLFKTSGDNVIDNSTGTVLFKTSGDNVIDNSIRSVHLETNEEQLLDNSTGSVHFEASGDNAIDNSIHFETNEEHLLDNSTGSVHFETNVDNEIVDGSVWESFDSKNDINFELENLQIGSKSPSNTGHVNQNGEDEPVLTGDNTIDNNLLVEYTGVLRDYKETKKRLAEIETKNQEHIQELSTQIKELMNVNAKKDDEILSLKQMLDSLNSPSNTKRDSISSLNETNKTAIISWHKRSRSRTFSILKDLNLDPPKETDEPNDAENSTPLSLEDKFRTDLDALLEENLEFWMRFSSSIQTMQDFQSKHQQIQKDENALEIKDLRALKTELQVWLEQNALLRSELKSRLSSIQTVQEEIELAVGPTFSSYQAAKFQGEVLNMQQENNRVANELKAGLDHVRGLQAELETTLERIQERVSISESRSSGARKDDRLRNMPTKNRVPLRSFLFPAKPKKPSIFALVNPVLHHPRQVKKSSFYTKLD